jgi:hypothetical protein
VARLGDRRETKIRIWQGGFEGGVFYGEEYDWNQRTGKEELHNISEVEEPTFEGKQKG